MDKKTMEFMSEMDSQKLEILIIAPEKPKAILQLAHGMCEHKERYLPFMEYMVAKGYVCVINDHRGHGGSVRSEKDLGYFNYNGGEYLVEDMHQVTEKIKGMYPQLPLILLGHSMGSLASRCYIKKYDDELAGVILCGCPARNNLSAAGLVLDKAMQFGKGARAKSSMLQKLLLGEYEKAYKSEGKCAWLCSNKDVVKAYEEDPLCNFEFTLNGYEALIWLSNTAHSNTGWEVNHPDMPVHLIAGSGDPCIVSRDRFRDGVNQMRRLGYREVTSYLYENMRHEILNEIGREQVYKDIADFCDDATWIKR